jgi:hypothetical protein
VKSALFWTVTTPHASSVFDKAPIVQLLFFGQP